MQDDLKASRMQNDRGVEGSKVGVTGLIPDSTIDITSQVCPMTFVRTRLALDRLAAGQVLAVRLQGEEPRKNVPRSAEELGHQILAVLDEGDGTVVVVIRKN